MSEDTEQEKGGFFKALKNFVVHEEKPDESEAAHVGTTISPISSLPPPPPAPGSRKTADPDFVRKIDEQAASQLQEPVEKVAGTYGEFMHSMEALAEAVPDVGAREKAVIKLLTKKKIPLERILSDLDACIGALEEQNRTFRRDSEAHLEKKIGGMKKEVEATSVSIESKKAHIKSLQEEVSGLERMRSDKNAEVQDAESNAALVQSRFTAVYGSIHSGMAASRKRISDLLSKDPS